MSAFADIRTSETDASSLIKHSIEDPSLDRVGGYLLGSDFVFPLNRLTYLRYQTNKRTTVSRSIWAGPKFDLFGHELKSFDCNGPYPNRIVLPYEY